ncbi:MAG: hypothetical protein ACLPZR_15295 [Solirubrobacteraceae bacterium]
MSLAHPSPARIVLMIVLVAILFAAALVVGKASATNATGGSAMPTTLRVTPTSAPAVASPPAPSKLPALRPKPPAPHRTPAVAPTTPTTAAPATPTTVAPAPTTTTPPAVTAPSTPAPAPTPPASSGGGGGGSGGGGGGTIISG